MSREGGVSTLESLRRLEEPGAGLLSISASEACSALLSPSPPLGGINRSKSRLEDGPGGDIGPTTDWHPIQTRANGECVLRG